MQVYISLVGVLSTAILIGCASKPMVLSVGVVCYSPTNSANIVCGEAQATKQDEKTVLILQTENVITPPSDFD